MTEVDILAEVLAEIKDELEPFRWGQNRRIDREGISEHLLSVYIGCYDDYMREATRILEKLGSMGFFIFPRVLADFMEAGAQQKAFEYMRGQKSHEQ